MLTVTGLTDKKGMMKSRESAITMIISLENMIRD